MNYSNGWPPTADHSPLLAHLMTAIADLSRSSGRIEATLDHVSDRLGDGDSRFQTIETKIDTMAGELSAMKAKPAASPSKIEEARKLAEIALPAIKEAWPFLAMLTAGGAKALGFNLSAWFGP